MDSIDAVDKFLNFIPLEWDRTAGETGKLSSAKKYSVVPCDNIKGRV